MKRRFCVPVALVLLAALLPVPAGGSDGAGAVHVNIVRAKALSCDDGFFGGGADLLVEGYLGDEQVFRTREATGNDQPYFAQLYTLEELRRGEPLRLRVTEGDSSLFSYWREECDLKRGEGRQANVSWLGSTETHVIEGDGGRKVELKVVMGTDPPTVPQVRVEDVNASSARLVWGTDPTSTPSKHIVRNHNFRPPMANLAGDATEHLLTDLKDNKKFRLHVVRVAEPWSVESETVTFRTDNVAPDPPIIEEARISGEELRIEWRNPSYHDVRKLEFFAGPSTEIPLDDDHRRGQAGYEKKNRHDTSDVSLGQNDRYVVMRTTDIGGLSAVSEAVRISNYDALQGKPQNVRANRTGDLLTVAWKATAPQDLVDFEVHAGGMPGFDPTNATLVDTVSPDPGTHRYTAKDLPAPAEATHVRVVAVDAGGNRTVSQAAPIHVHPPPQAPYIQQAATWDGNLRVRWTHPDPGTMDRFEVHTGPSGFTPTGGTLLATVTSWPSEGPAQVDGLRAPQGDLTVRVVAVGPRGQATASEQAVLEREVPPFPRPVISAATEQEGGLRVAWQGPSADLVRSFEIHAGASSGFTPNASSMRGGPYTAAPPDEHVRGGLDLLEGDAYVIVQATDDQGRTVPSAPARITTGAQASGILGDSQGEGLRATSAGDDGADEVTATSPTTDADGATDAEASGLPPLWLALAAVLALTMLVAAVYALGREGSGGS